jgi:hypothetical protein
MRLLTVPLDNLGGLGEKSEENSAESIENVVEANLNKNSAPVG